MKQDPYFDSSKEKLPGYKQVDKKPVAETSAPEKFNPIKRTFNSTLAEGIVWAEILSKPASKRKGHGRRGI